MPKIVGCDGIEQDAVNMANVAPMDPNTMFLFSIAVSLKRLAATLEKIQKNVDFAARQL